VVQKFVRPTSLAFKPGSFSTNRMLPMVSPDTPRPKKSYQQLYLNGHAYTYLGLKCTTRVFFCTLTKCQPTYTILPEVNTISMYSNWKVYKIYCHIPIDNLIINIIKNHYRVIIF